MEIRIKTSDSSRQKELLEKIEIEKTGINLNKNQEILKVPQLRQKEGYENDEIYNSYTVDNELKKQILMAESRNEGFK